MGSAACRREREARLSMRGATGSITRFYKEGVFQRRNSRDEDMVLTVFLVGQGYRSSVSSWNMTGKALQSSR